MTEPAPDVSQAMVDAAFPHLHGGNEFREEPGLRETLERPVREALMAALALSDQAAELAKVTADRDRLAGLYEAATVVLAGHLNVNCSMVAQVRDRASAAEPSAETD